ncbi:hypothetical protein QSV34_12620 [Porticoccus sp. W117]|uniref:hypothetical protein n=1 Tax=Porticoccus sp. W117 TaxID=3054777 RepID=UPI002594A82C|nr:hypothetical protein [Porticoccus sp. W117]MDM3872190.1 hypothetical protein [Porticoccus sp. W117]
MNEWIDLVKIVPAIVFPGAALIQLLALIKQRSASGVSTTTWWLFALANICLYLYTGKFTELAAIITFLGTATLNVAVAITAHHFNRQK